jgi:hypothetical protein
MANHRIMLQASSFLTQMGIPFQSVKMFGNLLVIHTNDYQSAEVIQSILNGSGVSKTGIEEPDRANDDYVVTGLINDALGEALDDFDDMDEEQ